MEKEAEGGGGGEIKKQPPQKQQKCPRCDSLKTKFCYYNNYSLSQPRYLCKACRRYWTQGGTLSNVPVGGGCRRRNKRSTNSSSSTLPGFLFSLAAPNPSHPFDPLPGFNVATSLFGAEQGLVPLPPSQIQSESERSASSSAAATFSSSLLNNQWPDYLPPYAPPLSPDSDEDEDHAHTLY